MAFIRLEWDNACKVCDADKVAESGSTQRTIGRGVAAVAVLVIVIIVVVVIVVVVVVVLLVTHDIFNKDLNDNCSWLFLKC